MKIPLSNSILKLILCAFVSLCLCVKTDAAPRFAALNDGTLTAAPTMLWPNPAPPTEAEYNARGYYRVVDEPPTTPAPEGYHYEPSGWELADGVIRRVYEAVQDPPTPPRTFSKYRLVRALQAAGLWAQAKAWLESVDGAYDLYLAAEDVSEDEPLLAQGIAALKAELSLTDEQLEALLSEAAQ